MAGMLPSFASGATLALRIGNINVAYGTNISFVDDVTMAPVGGIGAYGFDALEPTQYIARGNLSIMRYTEKAYNAIKAASSFVPARAKTASFEGTDGNSQLHPSQFNPVQLIVSRSFNIKIFERQAASVDQAIAISLSDKPIFELKDCRFSNYAMAFTPGSLVGENLGFMCIVAKDRVAVDNNSISAADAAAAAAAAAAATA